MFRISEVIVNSRGVGLSSDLIEELCQRGIRISFLSGGGRPYAMITSPMLNALIKLQQNVNSRSGALRLCELSEVIREIYGETRLDRYFVIKPAEKDALADI